MGILEILNGIEAFLDSVLGFVTLIICLVLLLIFLILFRASIEENALGKLFAWLYEKLYTLWNVYVMYKYDSMEYSPCFYAVDFDESDIYQKLGSYKDYHYMYGVTSRKIIIVKNKTFVKDNEFFSTIHYPYSEKGKALWNACRENPERYVNTEWVQKGGFVNIGRGY